MDGWRDEMGEFIIFHTAQYHFFLGGGEWGYPVLSLFSQALSYFYFWASSDFQTLEFNPLSPNHYITL